MVFLILIILIGINAMYVAAEFAAVSVRRSRIQQHAESGNRLAVRFYGYVKDSEKLDRYVATCQIGITLSSLIVGAYGQTKLSPMLVPLFADLGGMQQVAAESTSALVILLGLTAAQMVLGELVPKSLALQNPTPVALYTVIPMQWSIRLLSWFIKVLNGSGLAILRVMGVQPTGHVHIHTPDEIEYLIAESREGGLLDESEHARLREALRLGVATVNEVMAPRPDIIGIRRVASPEELLRLAMESPYSRFPVYGDTLDEILGYYHVQDIARDLLAGASELPPLRELMVIPESTSLEQALERLRDERQHIALVVDEYGGTAGLISIGDILEDIFGGLADEFKPARPEPEWLPDGRVRLPGQMRLSEAADLLDADWEGDAVTVGGFVMERLDHVPSAGDEGVIAGIAVTVERMAGRRVESVLARVLHDEGIAEELDAAEEAADE